MTTNNGNKQITSLKIHKDINGLVLTGGYSTRMGTDKSLLVYNGKPQRDFLFELLREFCGEVFTSCRHDQQVPANLNPLRDRFDFPGPMNGIVSAFAEMPGKNWLVVAVDMPFVDATALELLRSHRDPTKLVTCFYNAEQQKPEPLLSLWESHAYPSLLKFVEDGNVSPRAFLMSHAVVMINPPSNKTILNYNFPSEKPE